jgi:hypothetical protein
LTVRKSITSAGMASTLSQAPSANLAARITASAAAPTPAEMATVTLRT